MHLSHPQHAGELSLKLRVADLIASGLYSGRIRPAPGTWGTLTATILIAISFTLFPTLNTLHGTVTLALVLTAVAIWSAQTVWRAELYGAKDKDPQTVVIDEFAGYAVTIIGGGGMLSVVLAFLLFRVFDISKPFPVCRLEKLPGGFGIVLDDVGAGIYALLCRLFIEALLFST